VDHTELFESILESLIEISDKLRVVFPVHPRTRQRIAESGVNVGRLEFLAPLPYIDFLALQASATVVITDSGGIQEETTWLGIPCLTLRDNTERPITVSMGTNILVGSDPDNLRIEIQKILAGKPKQGRVPPLWDGHAAERIAQVLVDAVGSGCQPVDCMPSRSKPEPAGRLGL
jgi:UDP-N-acetylglucosamine 2-epimerase (non-hydrolysing)